MTASSRWEEVRDEFLELVECATEERGERLAGLHRERPALAREVELLLAHDRAEAPAPEPTPTRFGPYEVVRPLGRGGMGEVFVARRADGEYEREVAVKLLRTGYVDEELVRRFQRERQMLARLDHEYVAKLLDGGTTASGVPYLVMEYVEGERADRYAARLPLEARLRLFVRIGEAVQHAHERGFVHRDLKPSNVLVRADGTPRLLDFGIARVDESGRSTLGGDGAADHTLTRTGRRLFTPEYASPEQVKGEVATTRSDVFALGVLLYQFLTGASPWPRDLPLHRLEQLVCEVEPRPPSRRVSGRMRARLAGDLDAIALQCLAKDPRQRYATVAALSEDVERHLDGRTIRARRSGVLGRGIRLARRRPAVPALLALLAFTLATAWVAMQLERRDEDRRVALLEAVDERIDLAWDLRGEGKLDAAGAELRAALVLLEDLPPAPERLARIRCQQGLHRILRGDALGGRALLDEAREHLGGVPSPDPVLVQGILNTEVMAEEALGSERLMEARRRGYEHALERLEPGQPLRVSAQLNWVDALRRQGRALEGYELLDRAEAEAAEHDPRRELIGHVLNKRGVCLAQDQRFEEALEAYERALAIYEWNQGEGHRAFARLRMNIGNCELLLGRREQALASFERALATSRVGDDDMLQGECLHSVACMRAELGDLEGAEAAAREALPLREGREPEYRATRSRCQLAIVLLRQGQVEEADALFQEVFTDYYPGRLMEAMAFEARWRYGAWLQDEGRGAEAAPHLREALRLAARYLDVNEELLFELEGRLAVLE